MREVKQNFGMYLSRRRVKDVRSWLKQTGISTSEELKDFWDKMGLQGDLARYEVHFAKSVSTATTSQTASKGDEAEEVWHVPAAKRPLTKSSRKKSSRPAKKTVKKSSRSD